MPRLDENLLRKRCEHNDGEIGSLEELSLHQEDLEKLEHLQNWCKDLKILLLHSNLISKIENIGKLKKLEYINFSLNNIERIENLEGCESLNKLDFTLNFIGELTSVKNLKSNIFLESLFLMGNPCASFDGYREYVAAVLPQLKQLDGQEILISDRIKARQNFELLEHDILRQEREYKVQREKQKNKFTPTFIDDEEVTDKSTESFWNEKSEDTPETRCEIALVSRKVKQKGKNEEEGKKRSRPVKLFHNDGRPLCINQPKVPFTLQEDSDNNYILDISVYKYLDTNLLEVDVQPKYAKVLIKGKVFQITLAEEVSPDKSLAQRSQTTGHLVLTMPKVHGVLKPKFVKSKISQSNDSCSKIENRTNYLEFDYDPEEMDFSQITLTQKKKKKVEPIDESEVPPLE